SPIKFVTGSKLANHLMIDSLTLSLFSFQRAFFATTISSYQVVQVVSTSFFNVFFSDLINLSHTLKEKQELFSHHFL
ncbi:hypothetical protein, partial [Brevibacillus porteri]|uniref:hypothetical protein n=1 Tax=Brevibacillus porteri TaxID=2126350 RepID=UPI003638FCFE